MTTNHPQGDYPESFYRVSLKAIIKNDQGEVLAVRENGRDWGLPGGGLDHGEDHMDGLRRELHEEVLLDGDFTAKLVGIDAFYVEQKARWQMWIVYEVDLKPGYTYGIGQDADDVAFMSPDAFGGKDSLTDTYTQKWVQKTLE